ncbi:MAG TPA: 3-phosphoshikimate 1-carboxyvinyltransferase, partial [Thermoplasmata archaeon]|nr:3-phosphoshikimate 1-carboxyvinyltransferase [Thermoplasmata archaeon]
MAPPSKSYTHRAMVLGAITHSPFRLNNPLISEDTKATLDALTAFGTEVGGDSTSLKMLCEELRPALAVIDARNSGTTMRLIAGMASLLSTPATLTGDESLVKRPMGPLIDALTQLGVKCAYLGRPGFPPVTVRGPMIGSKTAMTGAVSSQFVSSLIIACSQKASDTEIQVTGEMRSRPYVDITIQMLRDFGGKAEETSSGFRIPGKQALSRDV